MTALRCHSGNATCWRHLHAGPTTRRPARPPVKVLAPSVPLPPSLLPLLLLAQAFEVVKQVVGLPADHVL